MARITPQEAIQYVDSHLNTTGRRAMAMPLEFVRGIGLVDESVYLLRRGDLSLVAPADDALTPILSESEETDFTIETPPAYEEILNDYAKEVDWWQAIGYELDAEGVPNEAGVQAVVDKDISPLIKTKWNQTSPWNQNIKFEGKSCYAGCVPISIAQLLYYWWTKGFSRGCTATEAYKTKTNLYEVGTLGAIPRFDYENMTLSKPTTTEGKKAVAEMLQHIGYAVHADYKPTGTGVSIKDYEPRLKSVFRLGDNIKTVYASKVGLAAFCEQIKKELASGRPVMMTGCNSAYTAAHSFICDGYRVSDEKFHYNFGWGGSYNGYFKMGAINPTSSRNFSYYKHAFLGIGDGIYKLGDVNRDGQVDVSDVLGAVETTLNGEYKEEADVNYDGTVDISDIETTVDNILGKTKL